MMPDEMYPHGVETPLDLENDPVTRASQDVIYVLLRASQELGSTHVLMKDFNRALVALRFLEEKARSAG